MISERLMGVGSWEVKLSPDTPHALRRSIAKFDQIVVTPAWSGNANMTRAELLGQARYRGPLFGWTDERTVLSGEGIASYLGDGGNIGAANVYSSATPRLITQWLSLFETDGHLNGLTAGTAYGSPLATWPDSGSSGELSYSTRQMIETLGDALDGVEYKVNVDGTIDTGLPGTALFRTSPNVLISRLPFGALASDVNGFTVLEWSVAKDYQEYLNYVRAYGDSVAGAASNLGGEGAKDSAGTNAIRRKVNVPAPGASVTADATNFAAGYLDRFENVRTLVQAMIDVYDPRFFMEPGDYIYVYDDIDVISDTSNQVAFSGETIHPKKHRLMGLDWPIEHGMGVYLLKSDASADPLYHDLTHYVQYDPPGVTLEIGARTRTAFDN